MIVTPRELSNTNVEKHAVYECPVCQVQSSRSKVEIAWVACPILYGRHICVGCCIDIQGVAHSESFETRATSKNFRNAIELSEKAAAAVRIVCLDHQIQISEEILRDDTPRLIDDEEIVLNIRYLKSLREETEMG